MNFFGDSFWRWRKNFTINKSSLLCRQITLHIFKKNIWMVIPCKSTFNWCRTIVSSASDSMRHSNVAAISFLVNTMDNFAFSENKPFASGPSLVDIDSIVRKMKKKSNDYYASWQIFQFFSVILLSQIFKSIKVCIFN